MSQLFPAGGGGSTGPPPPPGTLITRHPRPGQILQYKRKATTLVDGPFTGTSTDFPGLEWTFPILSLDEIIELDFSVTIVVTQAAVGTAATIFFTFEGDGDLPLIYKGGIQVIFTGVSGLQYRTATIAITHRYTTLGTKNIRVRADQDFNGPVSFLGLSAKVFYRRVYLPIALGTNSMAAVGP